MKNNLRSQLARWISFLLVIIFGILLGSKIANSMYSVKYDNSLNGLRDDYKTDVVLMIAEIYAADSDLPSAMKQVAQISNISPDEAISSAIEYGNKIGYTQNDISLMQELLRDSSLPESEGQ